MNGPGLPKGWGIAMAHGDACDKRGAVVDEILAKIVARKRPAPNAHKTHEDIKADGHE